MSASPLVSIIIPTYNRAHLIGETLDSVLAQTYQNWECIVVDDGSTDNTDGLMAQYMEKEGRFQYHHRPADRLPGGNAARNYGFGISKGEYIQWFDSDDLMDPNKIKFQLEKLINTNINFCACQYSSFFNDNRKYVKTSKSAIFSSNIFEDFIRQEIRLMTPSLIWRKTFLLSMEQLFDESLRASQEWEFFTRVLHKDSNYFPLNKSLILIRNHSESIQGVQNSEKTCYRFLTRLRVLQNDKMIISPVTEEYLRNDLVKSYKILLRNKCFQFTKFIYFQFIVKDRKLSFRTKYYASLVFLLYITAGKGYRIFEKF